MRITGVSVFQLDLPLIKPYRLSGGRLLFEQLDSTVVRIDTDEGVSGWGEACPWGSTYLPAFGAGVRAGLERLAPAVVGCDPFSLDRLNRHMDQTLPGHPYTKSALDIACWDIKARCLGRPVYDLLGGLAEGELLVNSSVSTDEPTAMLELISGFREKGYRVHSCKVGGIEPEPDIRRIEAIENNRIEGETYTYDANRAWLPATAIQVMGAVATPQSWYEQPCETIEECAQVRRHTRQAIVLDECLHSFQDLQHAVVEKLCDGVKLKPNRVGGLTKARLMRDFCVQNGIRMHIEDVGGTILADTAALHLAASTPAPHRLASWLCSEMLRFDLAPGQGARNRGGTISIPDGAGFDIEPDPELLGPEIRRYA